MVPTIRPKPRGLHTAPITRTGNIFKSLFRAAKTFDSESSKFVPEKRISHCIDVKTSRLEQWMRATIDVCTHHFFSEEVLQFRTLTLLPKTDLKNKNKC